ncbi:MAG: hypothetical protein KF799_05845 [Bdellovibrionales bacterium]|nr:hypothetical protein [Bdellovibrionales bacterium]
MFVDSYALISQRDGDVGDSLQREGMYAFGKWMRYNRETNSIVVVEIPERRDSKKIIAKFEVEPGVYVRHPDPTRWSSEPATTSRDQLLPVIAYCGAYQDYERLGRLFVAVAKRGFFAQNLFKIADPELKPKIPDTMIGTLGLFIRAGGWYTAPLYPLLLVTDTGDLISTLLNLIPVHWEESNLRLRWKEPRDVDDNNTVISQLMAVAFKPTPISWLNRQIYAWTRSPNNGNLILGERNPVMGALVWYHRTEAGGNPEMAELYRPLVEEYFSPRERYDEAVFHIAHRIVRMTRVPYLTTSL